MGTGSDLSKQNGKGVKRTGHCSGTMRIPLMTLHRGGALPDMESQIHYLETEAYSAVLKAFIAQSDSLSWGKEGLITELRRELRVSDVEHRELLGRIDSDETIRRIRDWREGGTKEPGALGQRVTFKKRPASSSAEQLHQTQSLMLTDPSHRGAIPSPFTVPDVKNGRHGGDMVLKRHDRIEIRQTDRLIYEIERVCGVANPDPVQVEKAKLILREHELSLLAAIAKLDDLSDGVNTPGRGPANQEEEEDGDEEGS
ncbi:protein EMSY-LIKE 3 isoform X2 [Amborella trichopoda]|uniref:ENT domain-containing protein n=1 Tax=Amborella trichopoda TaxID=13333 RepID=W1NDH8_AMBTC|nr:protein EMSY-LIKE 3 isoform X2 [Amborella trichopoda]XP_020528423.1 protein EMSY-LIKE 3 isoform X2 [Amborella trichopoda]ERM93552.1 hypothetical protein AMTR_s00004p00084710 [Amborella trichopoda]|eukprot:XP_011623291.1 protein EMSY-LIKE 3 isoform X2 [Amborella trichopoda]